MDILCKIGIKFKNLNSLYWVNNGQYAIVNHIDFATRLFLNFSKPRRTQDIITRQVLYSVLRFEAYNQEIESIHIENQEIESIHNNNKEFNIDTKKLNKKREHVTKIMSLISSVIKEGDDKDEFMGHVLWNMIVDGYYNFNGKTLVCVTHDKFVDVDEEQKLATLENERVFHLGSNRVNVQYNTFFVSNKKLDPLVLALTHGDNFKIIGYL